MSVAEAVTLIAAITAAITSIGAVAVAWRNTAQISAVHTLVNSAAARLESIAHDQGFADGVRSVGNVPSRPD